MSATGFAFMFLHLFLGVFRFNERNQSQKNGRQQRKEWEEEKKKPS